MFKCNYEEDGCFDPVRLCDGEIDCYRDGYDEQECPVIIDRCPDGYWRCADHSKCIKEESVCDGALYKEENCQDGSDEQSGLCRNWTCAPGYWKCHDKLRCIEERLVCNGYTTYSECLDFSDEFDCEKWQCVEGFWKCKDQSQCIRCVSRKQTFREYDL